MRILHLVLYSDSPLYNRMKSITETYYSLFPNVDTYYYMYDEHKDNKIENNILYIKGVESSIPGILDKTIKAFSYFLPDIKLGKYDYVIRSNVSTLVNMQIMFKYLRGNAVTYGGNLIRLWWMGGGITEEKYMGLMFVHGTAIVLHPTLMKLIVERKDLIRYDVIDDVAIALFVNQEFPEILPTYIKSFLFCNNYDTVEEVDMPSVAGDKIFYRNHSLDCDREKDVKMLQHITDYLKKEIQ